MDIFLNGDAKKVEENYTIAKLLTELNLSSKRLAVEINTEIVPRSQFGNHLLSAGDKVEIVHAIGGG